MNFHVSDLNPAATSLSSQGLREELICHCSASGNLVELIYNWLGPERQVELLSGTADETGEPAVYVMFHHQRNEVGELVIPCEELLREYPDITSVEAAYVRAEPHELGVCTYDDDILAGISNRFSPQFSAALMERVYGDVASVKLALCYATAFGGEARFQLADEWELEYCAEAETDDLVFGMERGLVSIHLAYHDMESGRGWGSAIYGIRAQQIGM